MSVINENNSVSTNNGDYNDVLFLTADAEEDNHIKSFNDEDFSANSNNISFSNNNGKNTSKLSDENNSFNLQISIDAGNFDFDSDNHKQIEESSTNYNHEEVLNVNINNHGSSNNNIDSEQILRQEEEHPSNSSFIHETTADSLSKEDNSINNNHPSNEDIITYSNNNEFNKNLDVSVDYALSDAKQQIINDILINDLKYLFKNTRYFLIKSNNYENVNLAKHKVIILITNKS
jgi:hypothetical protein